MRVQRWMRESSKGIITYRYSTLPTFKFKALTPLHVELAFDPVCLPAFHSAQANIVCGVVSVSSKKSFRLFVGNHILRHDSIWVCSANRMKRMIGRGDGGPLRYRQYCTTCTCTRPTITSSDGIGRTDYTHTHIWILNKCMIAVFILDKA